MASVVSEEVKAGKQIHRALNNSSIVFVISYLKIIALIKWLRDN